VVWILKGEIFGDLGFLNVVHVLVIQLAWSPSYIYVGGILSFVLSKNHLDPSSYYTFGGPSFLHTIHVLVIQLAWTPSYIYVGGLLSFVLSKNHLDPSSYYMFGGLLHFIPSKRNVTKAMLFEAYENLDFGRFHVLAALNWGPPTKDFKVQLNSYVELSKYMQEDLGITMQSTDL